MPDTLPSPPVTPTSGLGALTILAGPLAGTYIELDQLIQKTVDIHYPYCVEVNDCNIREDGIGPCDHFSVTGWDVSKNVVCLSAGPTVPSPSPAPSPSPSPAPSPGSGITFNGTCAGFENTKIIDLPILPDGAGQGPRYFTSVRGTFRRGTRSGVGPNDAVIVVFKAPPKDALFTLGLTHDGGSGAARRIFSISTRPCDFDIPKGPDATWADDSLYLAVRLSSDTPSSGYPDLVPGQTYYLNIKAVEFETSCAEGRCEFFISHANN